MLPPARFPDGMERRAGIELRVAPGRRLEGYAATFNSPALIGGQFTETVRPGAFLATLQRPGSDVLALVDHDMGKLLARTGSGTLRLAEDARGLRFDLDVPATTLGNDVLAMAERRDLGGMSFGFRTLDEAWPAKDRRELRSVELVEISIVHAHPAYPATVVSARARASSAAAEEARRRRRFMETI
jgi:HK97 family phage prohead protease